MNKKMKEEHLYADVLVIGGGMAGLFTAIKAREKGLDVILVDKGFVGRCGGTHYAEGDIQFFRPASRGHKMEEWLDMINSQGEYINNPEWDAIVLSEIEDCYNDLVSYGIEFYEVNGEMPVSGPHAIRGGKPVYEIISLKNRAYAPSLRCKAMRDGVRVYDRMMMCELLKQDGIIVGALGFNTTSGKPYVYHAKATVMCTGSSTAYKVRAMNTDYWTGDGECMAYRAGASVTGKEFRQANIPPTRAQIEARSKIYDGSELAGRKLNITGKYPDVTVQSGWFWPIVNAENTPTIEGGMWDVHCGKAPLYYDMDNMSPNLRKFEEAYFARVGDAEPKKLGLDFFNGGKLYYPSARVQLNGSVGGNGIWPTDKYMSTELPGLFAAGASCATMVCGSRYTGMGMGLSTGMVTGTRAAEGVAAYIKGMELPCIREDIIATSMATMCAPMERRGGFSPAWLTQALQGTVVPYYVLLIKEEKRLQAALTMVRFMREHLVPLLKANDPHEWRLCAETRNMITDAEMSLVASLFRKESRGSHYREDYPYRTDPDGLYWTMIHEVNEAAAAYKKPIPEKFWPDYKNKTLNEIYPWDFPVPDGFVLPENGKKD